MHAGCNTTGLQRKGIPPSFNNRSQNESVRGKYRQEEKFTLLTYIQLHSIHVLNDMHRSKSSVNGGNIVHSFNYYISKPEGGVT